MKNVTVSREWKTATGRTVTTNLALELEETIWADGDSVTVPCCKIGILTADVEGHPQQFGYRELASPRMQDGNTYVAAIGGLGLTDETNAIVQGMIAEINAHPAWVAKEEKIAQNRREISEMESARDSSGYCRKCGSYCYGDCSA